MYLFLIISAFSILQTGALIQWPFTTDTSYNDLQVTAMIGNPARQVNIKLGLYKPCPGLFLQKSFASVFGTGESRSFKKTADYKENNKVAGITGTDEFVIKSQGGRQRKIGRHTFSVADANSDDFGILGTICASKTTLSLAPTQGSYVNAFMDDILAGQKEKVVVFVYDDIPDVHPPSSKGALYIGGKPTRECSSKWHTVPAYFNETRRAWTFKLDSVSVGEYKTNKPQMAELSLASPIFELGKKAYKEITKELKSDASILPCNTKKHMTYSINGLDLDIQPDDYMGHDRQKGYCYFHGVDWGFYPFGLPQRVFRRYCLMLDYGNGQIGFAKKL